MLNLQLRWRIIILERTFDNLVNDFQLCSVKRMGSCAKFFGQERLKAEGGKEKSL